MRIGENTLSSKRGSISLWGYYLLSPILGITKEITSRGPKVLDMKYRDLDDLSMAPEGPSFL
jgi:hypothetical protein